MSSWDRPHPEVRPEGREPLPDKAGESTLPSRSGGENPGRKLSRERRGEREGMQDDSHHEKVPAWDGGGRNPQAGCERGREGWVLCGQSAHYENFLNDRKS